MLTTCLREEAAHCLHTTFKNWKKKLNTVDTVSILSEDWASLCILHLFYEG